MIAFTFSFIGCTKKVTKVESPAAKPVAEKVEKVEQEYIPSNEDEFTTTDMDAEMREVFKTIYFEFDKYTLRPEAIEKMEKIAAFLSKNKSVRVLIEGHADERGTDEYNIGLGENRSKSANDYLVNYGLSKNRFEIVSYGRSKPIEPLCPDETCHSKNRRVEWKILAK
jgi:peptidoglycan-associated lipoprotein